VASQSLVLFVGTNI